MSREIELDQLESVLTHELAEPLAKDKMTLALYDLGAVAIQGFVDIFANARDSQGSPWPEHAPATVAMYGPHPLLILSGTLRESLTEYSAPYHVHRMVDRTFEWGTTVAYAWVHQEGWAARNIPKREYCYWSEDMKDRAAEMLTWWIDVIILKPMTS
jgi:phage gpG-like protein